MIRSLVDNTWQLIPDEQLLIGGEKFAFGNGVYETLRTMNFIPVFYQEHSNRLIATIKHLQIAFAITPQELKKAVLRVISDFDEPNQRLRIIINNAHWIIYTSPLNLDQRIYKGVKVLTVSAVRSRAELKTTDYSAYLNAWQQAQQNHCFEAVLCDHNDQITEGSRSNIFWVKNRTLFTRENEVLPGITRHIVLKLFNNKVNYSSCSRNELIKMDEVFLTNSGSGIIPVIAVNEKTIGKGAPGEYTKTIKEHYDRHMIRNIYLFKNKLGN